MSDLAEFRHDFLRDVQGFADAGGQFFEDSFFDLACDFLIDVGELETADRARLDQKWKNKRVCVDGYGGDPSQSYGTLSLLILDFSQREEMGSFTQTDMDTAFKRLEAFLTLAVTDDGFRDNLEETTPAYGLVDLIRARWGSLSKIKLIIVSDRKLSRRVDGVKAETVGTIPVTYSVWDIERIQRLVSSGQAREEMTIDLESDFGGGIPVLPAHLDSAGYEAYLAVLPGSQLAAIYDHWSTRLLEQNVRVFLQARGNVNKGIRNTLDDEPERFFAYNNGITATAEGLEFSDACDGGLIVRSIKNLQIVNGGQTTASIHAAFRDKKRPVDLSQVFVQMKLSVIEPDRAMEIVPLISQYANSQNKVSAADFFSNHPFHVRIEEFSRRIWAPKIEGALKDTKWFYERARGQHADERSRQSGVAQKKFDEDYPRRQVFTKTDLAKFEMVWRERPEVVSKGAQKNFAAFAELIATEWDSDDKKFGEAFYRRAVAKAIAFRATERIVTAQPWYDGGYRANVVAYTLAKLAHDIREMDKCLDFEAIWTTQALPRALELAVAEVACEVHEVITDPPSGTRNVTEWAKQQACWKRVSSLEAHLPAGLIELLLSKSAVQAAAREDKRDQRELNGIAAQTAVVEAGPSYWRRLKRWAESRGRLTEKESSIIDVMVRERLVSEAQAMVLVDLVDRMAGEGCALAREFRAK